MKISVCMILMTCVIPLSACASGAKSVTGQEAAGPMAEERVEEALRALEKRASKGEDHAMLQLGSLYYEGRGVKQDYAKAMDWFLRAFAAENADAFVNLGVMHRDGQSVPANKKIAYCVFLATHMTGLGSESTQVRANSCLRRLVDELSKDDIRDCLSNYTLDYLMAYIEARGKMDGIPKKYMPSESNPALRDLDWWADHELDAIFGEPTAEEKQARQRRDEEREKEIAEMKHTLVFQIRFLAGAEAQYRAVDVITDDGMGSSALAGANLQRAEKETVYQDTAVIMANHHRFVTLDNSEGGFLVYEIDHPVKPAPCEWGKWRKPAYSVKDGMEKFGLLDGGRPARSSSRPPADAPELRFKVVKE